MRIHIENFQSIESFDAEFDSALYITGRNRAGKTSVLEAVIYALYGRCNLTDGKGAGADNMIRLSMDAARIVLHLDDVTVTCEIGRRKRTFSATFADGRVADNRADLWREVEIDQRHAELVAMMPRAFVEGDFDTIINQHLSSEIDPEDVYKLCGAHDRWLEDWMKSREIVVPNGIEACRDVGTAAYAVRTGCNKEIKEIDAEIARLGMPAPVEEPETIIATRLSELRTQRDALQRELGAAESAVMLTPEERAELETVAAQKPAKVDNAAWKKAVSVLESAKRGTEKALPETGVCQAAEKALAVAQNELAAATAAVPKGNACAACGRPWDAETKARLIEPAEKRQRLAQAGVERAQAAVAKAAAALDTAVERAKAEQKTAIAAAQAEVKTTEAAMKSAQAEAVRIGQEAADAKARLAAAVQTRAADAIRQDLSATDANIEDWNRKRHAVQDRDNIAGMQTRRAVVEAEVGELTWCVDAFKCGVVLNRLMNSDKKTTFMAAVNAELHAFGLEARLEPAGKALRVMLQTRDGWVPMRQCSGSERWILMFAFSLAFAKPATPIILDDVDHMDGWHKDILRQRLSRCTGLVILAGAWSLSKPPNIEGLAAAFAPCAVKWLGD